MLKQLGRYTNIARGVWGMGRLLREKEVDETPQGGFPEEAVKRLRKFD
ncbi:hypothetical protein GCM10011389_13710 [Pontibacillus salipaludis]|uniref:Uncharacterized protein n=1 Tax=Pontibacillus salipaludis TaxID=1697394 RepID=A0ABQ1PZ73_9BACI|nr:hypothetical protein GCM10011389_13710 [Pontibacillus salipaludis]